MGHKIKYILIVIGLLLIFLGVILNFNKGINEEEKNNYELTIDTKNINGDDIDNSNYGYLSNDLSDETTVKSMDLQVRNKYTLKYPNYLVEVTLDDTTKTLIGNEMQLYVNYNFDINLQNYKSDLLGEYDKSLCKVQSSDEINNKTYLEKYELYYFKINSLCYSEEENKNTYKERFILGIKEEDNNYLTVTLSSNNKKISDEFLTSFVNNIKIEDKVATYLYSETNGDNIIGTLKQLDSVSNQTYSLEYKIPRSKYTEKENIENNIYKTNFISNQDYTDRIEIEFLLNNNVDFIEEYAKNIKDELNDESAFEIFTFELQDAQYDNKAYQQITLEYKDKLDNSTHNTVYIINKLDNGIYYIVNIDSQKQIDEEIISDFLDVNLKIN